MAVVRSEFVTQAIDRPTGRFGGFIKELVVVPGRVPLSLVRKRSITGANEQATILLIHGFGQNRYAWHLPSRSFANSLAASGFDVFNLDLRGHGRSRSIGSKIPKMFTEYVQEDIPRALDEIVRITKRRDVFMIGHSLGGLIAYATAPQALDVVKGVVTIGSPYVFTKGSKVLSVLAGIVALFDKVGVPIVNMPLPMRTLGRVIRLTRPYLESPLYPIKLRGWHAGAIEPKILREHTRLAFDLASLESMLTLFRWAGNKAFNISELDSNESTYADRFERCMVPLLVIAGTQDDLAPAASVEPAYIYSQSVDKSYREFPLGHIDLLIGRETPRTVWPTIERWIHSHTQESLATNIRAMPNTEHWNVNDGDMP